MSLPLKVIFPDVGLNWPVIMAISVVLPAPFGPRRTRNSCSSTLKFKSFRIVYPDTIVFNFSTSSRAMVPSDYFVAGLCRTCWLPIALAVVRYVVMLFAYFRKRSLGLSVQPIAKRSNQSVGNPQHNCDEQTAHEELPIIGKPTSTEHKFKASHQESANERTNERGAASHRGPNNPFDRKQRAGIQERDDSNPGRMHRTSGCRHKCGKAE